MEEIRDLERLLRSGQSTRQAITAKTSQIYESTIEKSLHLRRGNFTAISGGDLRFLFNEYDQLFFDELLKRVLNRNGHDQLTFRVSPRLTSAGGKTTQWSKHRAHANAPAEPRYEIAISSTLLFQSFDDVDRAIAVNGILCHDRLQALQRIFEHELVHVLEMILWGESSCSAPRFRSLAHHLFAHTDVTHRLVTQRERAHVKFGIRVGDAVTFEFEGKRYQGVVNRITKRATVLVESERGQPYTDGKSYEKYYVPLSELSKATDHALADESGGTS